MFTTRNEFLSCCGLGAAPKSRIRVRTAGPVEVPCNPGEPNQPGVHCYSSLGAAPIVLPPITLTAGDDGSGGVVHRFPDEVINVAGDGANTGILVALGLGLLLLLGGGGGKRRARGMRRAARRRPSSRRRVYRRARRR